MFTADGEQNTVTDLGAAAGSQLANSFHTVNLDEAIMFHFII